MIDTLAIARREVIGQASESDIYKQIPERLETLAGKVESVVLPNFGRLKKHVHPLGYVSVNLDEVPEDLSSELYEPGDEERGRKRLHLWVPDFRPRPEGRERVLFDIKPDGYPRYLILNGGPHDHERIVQGRAVEMGHPEETYKDVHFTEHFSDEVFAPGETALGGLLRVHAVDYTDPDAQRLVDTGFCSRLVPSSINVILQGMRHIIPEYAIHQPVIPDNQGAGTVVYNTHRSTGAGPFAWFDGPGTPIVDQRRYLSPQEEERVEAYMTEAFAQRRRSLEGIEIDPYKAFIEKRPGLKDDIELAIKASRKVFPHDNGTRVGSVVVCNDKKFVGANVKRSAYNDTSCAERVALDQALNSHPDQIDRIVIYGQSDRPELQGVMEPCGSCRGLIQDALLHLPKKQRDVNIIMVNDDRSEVASAHLSQLLTHVRL